MGICMVFKKNKEKVFKAGRIFSGSERDGERHGGKSGGVYVDGMVRWRRAVSSPPRWQQNGGDGLVRKY